MDLCVLDVGCQQFSTSILAAAILYHFGDESQAISASGKFTGSLFMQACVLLSWMISDFIIPLCRHGNTGLQW